MRQTSQKEFSKGRTDIPRDQLFRSPKSGAPERKPGLIL